jgi:hypothetical protein
MKTNSTAAGHFEKIARQLIASARATRQLIDLPPVRLDLALAHLAQIGQSHGRNLLRLEISLAGRISAVYSAAQKPSVQRQTSGTNHQPKPLRPASARSSQEFRVETDWFEREVYHAQRKATGTVRPSSSAHPKTTKAQKQ